MADDLMRMARMQGGLALVAALVVNPERTVRMIEDTHRRVSGIVREYREHQDQISQWENEGGSCG